MSFKQLEERIRIGLWLELPKNSLMLCRRYLYEQGITLQELVAQVILMVENKDPAIKDLLNNAKNNKIANNRKQMVFTNSKALYNALEMNDPLKKQQDKGE